MKVKLPKIKTWTFKPIITKKVILLTNIKNSYNGMESNIFILLHSPSYYSWLLILLCVVSLFFKLEWSEKQLFLNCTYAPQTFSFPSLDDHDWTPREQPNFPAFFPNFPRSPRPPQDRSRGRRSYPGARNYAYGNKGRVPCSCRARFGDGDPPRSITSPAEGAAPAQKEIAAGKRLKSGPRAPRPERPRRARRCLNPGTFLIVVDEPVA